MGKYQTGGLYGTNTQSLFRTYEPLNLKAHVPEAAKILRERYDTAVEEKSLLDRAMGSIRTISDADAAKVNVAKYDINNNIIGDRVDYENMGKTIKDAATRLLTDHSIMRAQDSFANYQKELEENAALTRQGIKILDFNQTPVRDEKGKIQKDSLGNPLMQHVSKTWDSDVNGVYQRGSQAKLDWDAQAQQLIQGIAADSGPIREALSDAKISPEEAKLWLSAGEGVSKDKIKRIAQALKPVFLQTQEGMQMFNYLTRLEIDPKEGDLHRPEVAEKKMEDFLYNIGLKQAGWTNRYMQSAIDRSAGNAGPTLQDPLTIIAPREDLEKTEKFSDLEDLFNKDGSFKSASADIETMRGEQSVGVSRKESQLQGFRGKIQKTPGAARIENAVSKGEEHLIDWGNIKKGELAEWILTSDFVANHFDKTGKTDKQIVEEVADALRPRIGDKNIVPVSSEGASNLAKLAITNNQIFQSNGNSWSSLDSWADEGTKMSFESEKGLKDALNMSLELAANPDPKLSKENDVYNSNTVLRVTGKHAGKLIHSFTWNGKHREIILGPAAGMSEAFALNQAISRVRNSINPGKEEKITSLVVDENGNQREVTGKIKNKTVKVDGKSVLKTVIVYGEGASQQEIDASKFEDFQARVVLNAWANQGNLLKQTFNIHSDIRERPYTR